MTNEWIPCSERMPNALCDVLIWTRSAVCGAAQFQGEDKMPRWRWMAGHWEVIGITHWMPLPAPPKESPRASSIGSL